MQVFHCSAKLNGWMVGCMNGLYIFSYPIRDLLYGSSHLHLHGDARGCRKASTRCFFKDTLFLRTVRCIDCQRYFLVNSTIYHHKRLDNYVKSSKILLKLCHRKKWCCEGKTFHCRSTGFPTPGCQGELQYSVPRKISCWTTNSNNPQEEGYFIVTRRSTVPLQYFFFLC